MTTPAEILSRAFELARPEVLGIPAYNAGLSAEAVRRKYPTGKIARLASNENPLGASSQIGNALAQCDSAIYPDANSERLRAALSARCGVPASHIVVGNGSEDIIKMICEAFLRPNDRVVTVTPSFGLHESYPLLMGASVCKVPLTSRMTFDVPALISALAGGCHVLMFSNPSNPVGCHMTAEQLREVIDATPENALIVLDEAYYEYARGKDYPDSLAILREQTRPWIVLRTFSKAYGLAGLRVGYGLASDADIIGLLDRVRTPFNVNAYAQTAAITALGDEPHVRETVQLADAQREVVTRALAAMDLWCAPSLANFLFVDVRQPATQVAEYLLGHGVIVKPWKEAGYETFIRVTLGAEQDNMAFVKALSTYFGLDHS